MLKNIGIDQGIHAPSVKAAFKASGSDETMWLIDYMSQISEYGAGKRGMAIGKQFDLTFPVKG